MLRQILASIRAFLASLPRFVTQRVWDGMRWVRRLVTVPALSPEPEPAAPQPAAVAAEDEAHLNALKTVAANLAAGSLPAEKSLEALREIDIEWVMALDKPMLCRVATASDDALRGHIRHTATLKGVLIHDRVAAAEFRAARRRQREQERESTSEPGLVPAVA